MDMREVFKLAEAKMSNREHYRQVMNRGKMPAIDPDEYPPIKGMEGPFRYRSGHVLYYDPKEGKYYDRKSDMYLSNREATKIVMEGDIDGVDEGCGLPHGSADMSSRDRKRSKSKSKRKDLEPIGVPTRKLKGRKGGDMAEDVFMDSVDALLGFSDDEEMPEVVPEEPAVVGYMGELFEYVIDEAAMKAATVQIPIDKGYSHEDPIPSKMWTRLKRFWTQKEAKQYAKEHGLSPKLAHRMYGRFERAWLLVDDNGNAVLAEDLQEAMAAVPSPMGGGGVMGMGGAPDMAEMRRYRSGPTKTSKETKSAERILKSALTADASIVGIDGDMVEIEVDMGNVKLVGSYEPFIERLYMLEVDGSAVFEREGMDPASAAKAFNAWVKRLAKARARGK